MTINRVLENWKEYDDKKIENSTDPNLFSCDEAWEIFYLKNKIIGEFPFIEELKIFEAIEACENKQPIPRILIVQKVIHHLGLG